MLYAGPIGREETRCAAKPSVAPFARDITA